MRVLAQCSSQDLFLPSRDTLSPPLVLVFGSRPSLPPYTHNPTHTKSTDIVDANDRAAGDEDDGGKPMTGTYKVREAVRPQLLTLSKKNHPRLVCSKSRGRSIDAHAPPPLAPPHSSSPHKIKPHSPLQWRIEDFPNVTDKVYSEKFEIGTHIW